MMAGLLILGILAIAWTPKLCLFGGGLGVQELFCTDPWPKKLVRDYIFDRFSNHACVISFILRDFEKEGGGGGG